MVVVVDVYSDRACKVLPFGESSSACASLIRPLAVYSLMWDGWCTILAARLTCQ